MSSTDTKVKADFKKASANPKSPDHSSKPKLGFDKNVFAGQLAKTKLVPNTESLQAILTSKSLDAQSKIRIELDSPNNANPTIEIAAAINDAYKTGRPKLTQNQVVEMVIPSLIPEHDGGKDATYPKIPTCVLILSPAVVSFMREVALPGSRKSIPEGAKRKKKSTTATAAIAEVDSTPHENASEINTLIERALEEMNRLAKPAYKGQQFKTKKQALIQYLTTLLDDASINDLIDAQLPSNVLGLISSSKDAQFRKKAAELGCELFSSVEEARTGIDKLIKESNEANKKESGTVVDAKSMSDRKETAARIAIKLLHAQMIIARADREEAAFKSPNPSTVVSPVISPRSTPPLSPRTATTASSAVSMLGGNAGGTTAAAGKLTSTKTSGQPEDKKGSSKVARTTAPSMSVIGSKSDKESDEAAKKKGEDGELGSPLTTPPTSNPSSQPSSQPSSPSIKPSNAGGSDGTDDVTSLAPITDIDSSSGGPSKKSGIVITSTTGPQPTSTSSGSSISTMLSSMFSTSKAPTAASIAPPGGATSGTDSTATSTASGSKGVSGKSLVGSGGVPLHMLFTPSSFDKRRAPSAATKSSTATAVTSTADTKSASDTTAAGKSGKGGVDGPDRKPSAKMKRLADSLLAKEAADELFRDKKKAEATILEFCKLYGDELLQDAISRNAIKPSMAAKPHTVLFYTQAAGNCFFDEENIDTTTGEKLDPTVELLRQVAIRWGGGKDLEAVPKGQEFVVDTINNDFDKSAVSREESAKREAELLRKSTADLKAETERHAKEMAAKEAALKAAEEKAAKEKADAEAAAAATAALTAAAAAAAERAAAEAAERERVERERREAAEKAARDAEAAAAAARATAPPPPPPVVIFTPPPQPQPQLIPMTPEDEIRLAHGIYG